MNDEALQAQRKRDEDKFSQVKESIGKQLPTHVQKEFTFDRFEQQLLAEQQTIIALAGETQNKIINEICLKRLGIQPSPQVHVRYAIGLGKLVLFIPSASNHETSPHTPPIK